MINYIFFLLNNPTKFEKKNPFMGRREGAILQHVMDAWTHRNTYPLYY